jgi:hypothetical protein
MRAIAISLATSAALEHPTQEGPSLTLPARGTQALFFFHQLATLTTPMPTTQSEIVVVSGLPRSGTSLMMQMLDRGGLGVVTDHIRTADTDNPKGYYEFERVKKIKSDKAWLPDARGKVVKMISMLLYDLPPSESYRVVFMERELEEVLDSQEKMLARLGNPSAPRDQVAKNFKLHLAKLKSWLASQKNIGLLYVSYNDLMQEPAAIAAQVNEFLGGQLDVEEMTGAVDPALYRNRVG